MVANLKKTKCVFQGEHSECGLAVITSILDYYKIDVQLDQLREKYGVPRGGLSFQNIRDIMKEYGIFYKGIKVSECGFLKSLKQPAILFWGDNHFVVFYRYIFGKYFVMDPQKGYCTYTQSEIENLFGGLMLIFERRELPVNYGSRRPSISTSLVIKLLTTSKKWISFTLIFTLVVKLLSLVVPIISQRIIDNRFLFSSISMLNLILIICGFVGVYYISNLLSGIFLTKIRVDWNFFLSNKFMDNVLNKVLLFFVNRSSGSMIYKTNLITMIQQILSGSLVENALDYLFMIIYFVFLFNYSAKLTIVVLLVCTIVLIISIVYSKKNNQINDFLIEAQSDVQKQYIELFTGMETIKSLGKEKEIYKKWKELFEKALNQQEKQGILFSWLGNIPITLLFATPLIIVIFGMKQVDGGYMTMGQLVGFIALSSSFIEPFSKFIGTVSQFFLLKSYFNQIYEIIDSKSFINRVSGKEIDHIDKIEVKEVSFAFSEFDKNILDNINLVINKGEKIAIVGKSGSGKSTLLKILTNLYPLKKGGVFINDESVESFSNQSIRKKMSYVTQNSTVFGESLYDNLFLSKDEMDTEKLEDVLQVTDLLDVSSSYSGLNTLISENGQNLSGGQIQRISIARCLLNNPDVLILDEPTSSLDNISENKILSYIYSSKMTVIVVAHRLNTIKRMDRIIVLDNGRLVEEGSHEELIRKKGMYYSLYNEEFE